MNTLCATRRAQRGCAPATSSLSAPAISPLATIPRRPKLSYQPFHTARSSDIIAPRATDVTAATTQSSSAPARDSATTSASSWSAFGAAASGEWDGITATFQPDGAPRQLPEYYVPQAFRDWGVELCDWTSQCSMRTVDTTLQYSVRRMMPTVGCEADAIAFSEDSQEAFSEDSNSAIVAADGGYTRAPLGLSDKQTYAAAVEHCLPVYHILKPEQPLRVRVVHRVKRMGRDQLWMLTDIELHKERRDGPWTGRRELAGCGGGMPTFAATPAFDVAAALSADKQWKASGVRMVVSENGTAVERSVVHNEPWSLPETSSSMDVVGLPLNVWSAASVSETECEFVAGVLLEDGSSTMKVSRQRIVDGVLREAELLTLSQA